MPFRPELNYFYSYLKRHLEEKYGIRVERGDSHVLAKEIVRKVSEQIGSASFLIADITGGNPNVFFELGMAYERGLLGSRTRPSADDLAEFAGRGDDGARCAVAPEAWS